MFIISIACIQPGLHTVSSIQVDFSSLPKMRFAVQGEASLSSEGTGCACHVIVGVGLPGSASGRCVRPLYNWLCSRAFLFKGTLPSCLSLFNTFRSRLSWPYRL